MADRQQLDRFLAGVERSAWRVARLALNDGEEALDAVQDAMFKLVKHYADKPEAELKPLFYGILRRRIVDLQRRRSVRNRLFGWLDSSPDAADPLTTVADPGTPEPATQLANEQALEELGAALRALPARQQQAFTLRILEELDVAQTAQAMNCSQGSVKTHLSRALHNLRGRLEAHA